MPQTFLPNPEMEAIEDSPIIDVVRVGLEIPDIAPLWLGESDVPTPAFICDAAVEALRSGETFYTPNRGIVALRKAIARYYERIYGLVLPDERICVTNSGMHAANMIAKAILRPGDNAVLVTPCWPNIERSIRFTGTQVREVALDSKDGCFELNIDALRQACDENTRLLYMASPGNPTGWMISESETQQLVDLSRKLNIAIISDEVYQRLSFDDSRGKTLLNFTNPEDPIFVINSFSKAWAMTGWRLGWTVYPEAFLGVFEKLSQFTISGSPAFVQQGGIAALEQGEDFVRHMWQRCKSARDFVESSLSAIDGIRINESQGGFYSMFKVNGVDDSVAFCQAAARESLVGLAPGAAFGSGGEGFIRLCYARKQSILEQAVERLACHVKSCL